jgi:2-C-methyl-D-erythritol 2,4-cyclodiphosphate synthase
MSPFRIGHGFDVHKYSAEDKPLLLAGVEVHPTMGVEAHSDGDVLLHSLCDALLGSVALRDIGYHFPDTDVSNKNKDSAFFTGEILKKVQKKGYKIGNIDITVIAQEPKLLTYIPKMVGSLAKILSIGENDINIKATTTERLGFIGRVEGISVHSVVLVYQC